MSRGIGGLRDLHTLYWITQARFDGAGPTLLHERGLLTAGQAERMRTAETFFWTVRFHLHLLTGRGEDRLTFDCSSTLPRRWATRRAVGNRRLSAA